MTRTWNVLAAIAALAAAATAQTRFATELSTAEAAGVHANRQIDAVRAGTIATRAIALTATDARVARASSTARPTSMGNAAGPRSGAAFTWDALAADGASAGTLGGNPLAAGLQHYQLRLTATSATTGTLAIGFGGHTRGAATAHAAVRVGQDGRRFAADGTAQRDAIDNLTVGPRGLVVDVFVGGDATGANGAGASYAATLHVAFVPDGGPTCTVTPSQRSCAAGGVLQGSAQAGRPLGQLALGLTGALPNAIGLTIVSPTGRTFPINGTQGCIFFGTPIVHGTFTTDANGNARTLVPFPLRSGGAFFVQQATLLVSPRGFALGTSNTLEVRCN